MQLNTPHAGHLWPVMDYLFTILRVSLPFVSGGLAGCLATLFVLPSDTLKVWRQLPQPPGVPRPSTLSALRTAVRADGPFVLWKGLSAALARQVVYTAARMGLFSTLSDAARAHPGVWGGPAAAHAALYGAPAPPPPPLPLLVKCALAAGAGSVAAALSTPLDLALTRIQAENAKPAAARRPLGGPLRVLRSVATAEGALGLWRGAAPTITRAAVLNVGMLAVNEELKERLVAGGVAAAQAVVLASFAGGVCAALVSLPADMVKTRIQASGGKAAGMLAVARELYAAEGLRAFWRGAVPYTLRIAPHCVITLLSMPVIHATLKEALV